MFLHLTRTVSASALMLAVAGIAAAQTRITTTTGSSYSSSRSSSWSSGPGGFSSQSRSTGQSSQWGSVSVDARTPGAHFQGTFSAGSSRSWDVQRGSYGGPFGSGNYGSVYTSRSNWDNGAWRVGTPGGVMGGSYTNVNRESRGRTWSNSYP
jgi:hypothetical protein